LLMAGGKQLPRFTHQPYFFFSLDNNHDGLLFYRCLEI
jgi:hypothetical protein